jgi:hypothetical protein
MTAETEAERELREKIAAEAAAFEADPDPDAVHYVRHRRPPRDPVYTLRLPRERIEQLRVVAEARGMDASTLARQWIVDQLDTANRLRDRGAERWERDLRTTTKTLEDQAVHLRHLLDERPGA